MLTTLLEFLSYFSNEASIALTILIVLPFILIGMRTPDKGSSTTRGLDIETPSIKRFDKFDDHVALGPIAEAEKKSGKFLSKTGNKKGDS